MEKVFKKNANKESSKSSLKEGITEGMSWREWKKSKKEEYKKHKQEKLLKKLKKSQDSQNKNADSKPDEGSIRNDYTVSIAVPGSILDNAQSPELKTYLAGQIARAAAVFNVNEVIVFSENIDENFKEDDESLKLQRKNQGCVQLVRILQYLECPQYLRKFYFPIHNDFAYAGLLNPLDIPSHLREDEDSKFREGIVLEQPVKQGKGSFVYIGLRKTAIIDKTLQAHVRTTVQLDAEQPSKKHLKGKAVPPTAPFKLDSIYWGYNVRLAKSFKSVFEDSPYKSGYDILIGTSDKGQSVDSLQLPKFKHLLIVFGGLKGIESCLEGDEYINSNDPSNLFTYYLNTCPSQGSRTIRTEEAILITMAAIRPKILQAAESGLIKS